MRVLPAAVAESRVEAPGVIRRVLVPQFGADPFAGVGPLRAVHLLDVSAGATLPARRLANLSVLRFCWTDAADRVWLLRQDCGAGAELAGWTAPVAVSGVECWVQSRRSNGTPRTHFETRQGIGDLTLAAPGAPGWDTSVRVECVGGGVGIGDSFWCQLLRGSAMLGGHPIHAGDGVAMPVPAALQLAADSTVLCLRGG